MFGNPANSPVMFGMPDYIKDLNQKPMQPSPIRAPQGRGMFGRFANMLGKGGAGAYGKSGMSNALFLLGAGLSGASAGDPAKTAQMMSGRKAELTEDRERERMQALLRQAATGNMQAIGQLDPIAAQNMRNRTQRNEIEDARYDDNRDYTRGRDALGDERYETEYADTRGDRASDVNWRERRAGIEDGFTERGLGLQEQTLAAKQAANQRATDKETATAEGQLRREFLGQNKPFQEVQRAYDRVNAVDTSNAAGQMGLIFQYMKMLDPGSTVREGEFATAQNTTGIPGQVINAYNKAAQGEFLNPDQVADFKAQADHLYSASADGFERSFQDYRARSDSYGYDGDRTIPDLRNGRTQVTQISDDAGYDALPSGAQYVGPDGVTRRKP